MLVLSKDIPLKLYELKEHREALGYQIERIADLMKVRQSVIEAIETDQVHKNRSQFDIFCIRRYCDILGVDFNSIEFDTPTDTSLQPAVRAYSKENSLHPKKIAAVCIVTLVLVVSLYQYIVSNKTKPAPLAIGADAPKENPTLDTTEKTGEQPHD